MTRHAPGRPFPAYAFVPGHAPHPRTCPGGHSYGLPEPEPEVLDAQDWKRCELYRFGIDLFNHGYYWEAHEAWEGMWRAAEPGGPVWALLKGLIRLAAAGVKVRQGRPESVRSHGTAARQQFHLAQQATGQRFLCGLDLEALGEFALRVSDNAPRWRGDPERPVQVVFDRALSPTGTSR